MTYRGRVQDGVVVLEQPGALPDGTEVCVEPVGRQSEPVPPVPRRTLAERLANVIGTATDLPEDMAENHDHYLHGAPKR
jgi:hypothetical protein